MEVVSLGQARDGRLGSGGKPKQGWVVGYGIAGAERVNDFPPPCRLIYAVSA
jgi:hypothetical protein